MTTDADPDRLTLRASSPEDLLALVPVVLGFQPEESVTMLSLGGRHPFHARLDLPPPGAEDEACAALVRPVVLHDVTGVAVVLHSGDVEGALDFGRLLRSELEGLGVRVSAMVCADGERWWSADAAVGPPDGGTRYDVSDHPFVLQSILRGDVVHRSRGDLAATLVPDTEGIARVEEVLRSLDRVGSSGLPWAVGAVRRRVEADEEPTDTEVAHVLATLDEPSTVDRLVDLVTRPSAARHARFWSSVVRRAPVDRRGRVAGVLALAAWLSGHGALAWCAVDVAARGQSEEGLAVAVRTALEQALPPDAWWNQGVDDPA